MPLNAGIWIDHQQAVVVLISQRGEDLTRIGSGIIHHPWPVTASPTANSHASSDFAPEDRLERKHAYQLNAFYDEVIDSIAEADAILLLGPGEAKRELQKRFKSRAHRGLISEFATVDNMTDRQITARVREHFSPRGKTATSTKPS